jgi:hypothetical protein
MHVSAHPTAFSEHQKHRTLCTPNKTSAGPSSCDRHKLKGLQVSSSAVCKHGHAHLPLTLDPAMQHANALLIAGPTVADHEAFWAEWALRIQTLERGIEQARQQGISVSRAKRVLKELQAQANAAEAAAKLEALLLRKPCKASLLKVCP